MPPCSLPVGVPSCTYPACTPPGTYVHTVHERACAVLAGGLERLGFTSQNPSERVILEVLGEKEALPGVIP